MMNNPGGVISPCTFSEVSDVSLEREHCPRHGLGRRVAPATRRLPPPSLMAGSSPVRWCTNQSGS